MPATTRFTRKGFSGYRERVCTVFLYSFRPHQKQNLALPPCFRRKISPVVNIYCGQKKSCHLELNIPDFECGLSFAKVSVCFSPGLRNCSWAGKSGLEAVANSAFAAYPLPKPGRIRRIYLVRKDVRKSPALFAYFLFSDRDASSNSWRKLSINSWTERIESTRKTFAPQKAKPFSSLPRMALSRTLAMQYGVFS